jgi:AICAR transformylase/IMP cyclohydrolase PurH
MPAGRVRALLGSGFGRCVSCAWETWLYNQWRFSPQGLGVELLSTGGTQKALTEAGLKVTPVGEYTGAPEILGGRVKTLHPRVHGGILYRRGLAGDEADVKARDIPPIDLVVVNLYPFREAVAAGKPFPEVVEEIDIGGPAMVRSSAKNAAHVGVVVDPADYEQVASEIEAQGSLSDATRFALMKKAFAHTAAYDAAITEYLSSRATPEGEASHFPATLAATWNKVQDLRYGENPHQAGAFYRAPREPEEPTVSFAKVLQGKGAEVTVFLMADAVACAKAGQKVPQGYYNLELMVKSVARKGVVLLCGTCMDARGITDADVVEGARRSTMDELAEATLAADRVLVF